MSREISQLKHRLLAGFVGLAGALGCLSAPGIASGESAAAHAKTLTYTPAADARLEEANPATNFGARTRLGTDGDAGLRVQSVLRFDVRDLAPVVRSARLRLYVVSDGTRDGPEVYPAIDDWTEAGVTWDTRPATTGQAAADIGAAPAGSWIEIDVTPLVTGNGSISILLAQPGTDGVSFYAREGAYKPQLIVTSADPVVLAAGDIACRPGALVTAVRCRQQQTSDLLVGDADVTRVLALGDTQYEDGLESEFTGVGAYEATWGRRKSVTKPVPGNHEYHTPQAAGYFDYFGEAAGERGNGYYSFDLGPWHLIALNSEISTALGSDQERWLRSDLAATTKKCILAYWHKPRFSSGYHGGLTRLGPLWGALYEAQADVVLNAHDHSYERFAPQSPDGVADPSGIRQFVVGTGGASHSSFGTPLANSEVRDSTSFGVLKLALHGSSYDWEFLPEPGGTFTDAGSGKCHDAAPAASVNVAPSSGVAPLTVSADASASSDADRTPIESYSFDFGDGSPIVGPQGEATATHTYRKPGTYTVTVTVTDTAGQVGKATAQVIVEPNLVHNPEFESDLSGWNTSGSGAGITLQRATGGHSRDWAAKLTNTGASSSTCALNDSPDWAKPTSAGTYTGSIWVRADAPGAALRLRFREWSGTTLVGTAVTPVTLSTSWQQVKVNYTIASPGSTLDFNAYVVGAAPGACFYADDAVIALD